MTRIESGFGRRFSTKPAALQADTSRVLGETEKGMIDRMFNLICGDGHRFYAPRPAHWEGRACEASGTRCTLPLHRIQPGATPAG